MKFGLKITELRKNKNMTQEDMADLFGVTRQTISNWENDKSYPDITLLFKISEVFNISLDELLKEDKKIVNNIVNNERKKKIFKNISIILVIILLIIIGYFIFDKKEKSKSFQATVNYNYVKAIKTLECDKKPVLYYKENNQSIYLYCLDEVTIINDNKSYELKEYLDQNELIIDWFISLFEEKEIYDNKNKLYNGLKDSGWYSLRYKFSNDEVKIIKCNSSNNTNVYIGSIDMAYDKKLCD